MPTRRSAAEASAYAPALQFALVHHTVDSNAYSCDASASIVRGIEVYHVKGNGWDDIGYNFLVDACGQVFEGRYGGIDEERRRRALAGFNSGSVGVAMIGTYGAHDAVAGRAGRAREAARVAPRRRARRSALATVVYSRAATRSSARARA